MAVLDCIHERRRKKDSLRKEMAAGVAPAAAIGAVAAVAGLAAAELAAAVDGLAVAAAVAVRRLLLHSLQRFLHCFAASCRDMHSRDRVPWEVDKHRDSQGSRSEDTIRTPIELVSDPINLKRRGKRTKGMPPCCCCCCIWNC